MRILLADDSRTSRKYLSRTLESWGYEVVQCADGREAYDALRADDAPGMAILDWIMPEMDGIDVCRRIRAEEAEEQHTFIYLLSARTSDEDVLAGLEAGADDYLTKPANLVQLRVRLRNGARVVQMHQQLHEARESLRTQAMRDPLTEVWNRRAFDEIAEAQLNRCRRSEAPMAVLMVDLDHFKRVNDEHGHATGDLVLKEACTRMSGGLRRGDELARYGGEEFVVLLPNCNGPGARLVAERVRQRIARGGIDIGETVLPVTASIGIAWLREEESVESLIDRADKALYRAKESGRNRTAMAEPCAPRRTTKTRLVAVGAEARVAEHRKLVNSR